MVAKIEIRVGGSENILIFKDATPSFSGEVITNRVIEVQTVAGTITIPFAYTGSLNDEVSYTFSKPYAVKAKLIHTPSSPVNGSVYSDTVYTAMLNKYKDMIKSKVTSLIYTIDPKNILTSPQSLLREIEWCKALYDAAGDFIQEGDLTSSQESIDGLEEISKAV